MGRSERRDEAQIAAAGRVAARVQELAPDRVRCEAHEVVGHFRHPGREAVLVDGE